MTEIDASADTEPVLCHFNLAIEENWEVAEELNNGTKQNRTAPQKTRVAPETAFRLRTALHRISIQSSLGLLGCFPLESHVQTRPKLI